MNDYHLCRIRAKTNYETLCGQALQHEMQETSGGRDYFVDPDVYDDFADIYDSFADADFVGNNENPAIFPQSGNLSPVLPEDISLLQSSRVLDDPIAAIVKS